MAEDVATVGIGARILRAWPVAVLVWMCLAAYALYELARYVLFVDELARILGGPRAATDLWIWFAGALLLLAGIILPSLLLGRAWRRAAALQAIRESDR